MPPVVLTVSQNTFISSAKPNDNLAYHPLLYIGYDEIFESCISLLKFDFTTIPTNTVDSAFLQLSVIVESGTDESVIGIARIEESFDAFFVTYETSPKMTPPVTEKNISSEDVYKTVQIEVTQLVNDWLSGVHPNFGLALIAVSSGSMVQFGSDKIVWEPYFPKLVLNYSVVSPESSKSYCYVYNSGNEIIAPEQNVPFGSNGALKAVSHPQGSDTVTFEEKGSYAVWYSVSGSNENQFALFLNDNLIPGSTYGIGLPLPASNVGMTIVSAKSGDKLTLKNHTSGAPVHLCNSLGGTQTNVSASLLIIKLGSAEDPIRFLAAVNAAQTEDEMRIAIANPDSGLNLNDFDTISGSQQTEVLAQLMASKPDNGYSNVLEIQSILEHSIDSSVDHNNIYVEAGSSEGIGNPSHPFGSIEDGLSSVEAGGTVHIAGTFEVAGPINITKAGVTLLSEGNAELVPTSDLIPIIINAPAVTLNGLTIRNAERHPTELIRIMSTDINIINCNLSGPGKKASAQLLAGISAVSEAANNYNIQRNIINSMDTGIHLLEYSQGVVSKNNISDTRYGISLDGGTGNIINNSWLGLPNDADINITARTAFEPPYDNVQELSEKNNAAVIVDERAQ